MQLSEHKTYRTRDGSRTKIQLEPNNSVRWPFKLKGEPNGTSWCWGGDGNYGWGNDCNLDLIEEQPATPQPFSYDACPVGEDGRKRAVTRDGREVILLSNLANGLWPIVGQYTGSDCLSRWTAEGEMKSHMQTGNDDLLIPSPPKRVVWVNLYGPSVIASAGWRETEAEADELDLHEPRPRLGNRAYPIEVE